MNLDKLLSIAIKLLYGKALGHRHDILGGYNDDAHLFQVGLGFALASIAEPLGRKGPKKCKKQKTRNKNVNIDVKKQK